MAPLPLPGSSIVLTLGFVNIFGLFGLFGLFRHKMGKWAPKIYPIIAAIIIAVAVVVVVIVINGIVMPIEV